MPVSCILHKIRFGLAAAALVAPSILHAAAEPAYILSGPGGSAVLRTITYSPDCPIAKVDGKSLPMALRVAMGMIPQRSTRSAPDDSKASVFPVNTCDLHVPDGARSVIFDGRAMPLPKPTPRRIVVIGDTGCRLKKSDDAYQACNDPAAYPFARIAAQAAAWKPDLVVHVGDYHYRENACPTGNSGCEGSPWGYGWDAWNADFFTPAAPLLGAAPWVVVRGNHESCVRAGQGWWRFLDPRPLEPRRDCNDAANDDIGDYSDAYAVPIGRKARLVVMDMSGAGGDPQAPDAWQTRKIAETYHQLAALSAGQSFVLAADHYPIIGIGAYADNGVIKTFVGSPAITAGFSSQDPNILPGTIDALLAGHIHLWEQADYGGKQPSQFIAGFSGTLEDEVPLSGDLAGQFNLSDGTKLARFSSLTDRFGYMTMERIGRQRWSIDVHGLDGKILKHCLLRGRRSVCAAR